MFIDDFEHNWSLFAVPSGTWQGVLPEAYSIHESPNWSSQGDFCIVHNRVEVNREAVVMDLSAGPPVELQYFGKHTQDAMMSVKQGAQCTFVPGTQHMIQVSWASITHWMYNPETHSILRCDVPGTDFKSLKRRSIAWHPTLKSAAIYAIADVGKTAAMHLISARRHSSLLTRTSQQLAGMPAASFKDDPRLAWCPDGKKLAISNSSGTAILRF